MQVVVSVGGAWRFLTSPALIVEAPRIEAAAQPISAFWLSVSVTVGAHGPVITTARIVPTQYGATIWSHPCGTVRFAGVPCAFSFRPITILSPALPSTLIVTVWPTT